PEPQPAGSPPPPPGGDTPVAPVAEGATPPTKDERTMAMLAHFFPLIVWLIKKDESAFVDDQGKEGLNFGITMMIGAVGLSILGMIPLVGCATCVLFPAWVIVWLVFVLIGGLKANEGVRYRY